MTIETFCRRLKFLFKALLLQNSLVSRKMEKGNTDMKKNISSLFSSGLCYKINFGSQFIFLPEMAAAFTSYPKICVKGFLSFSTSIWAVPTHFYQTKLMNKLLSLCLWGCWRSLKWYQCNSAVIWKYEPVVFSRLLTAIAVTEQIKCLFPLPQDFMGIEIFSEILGLKHCNSDLLKYSEPRLGFVSLWGVELPGCATESWRFFVLFNALEKLWCHRAACSNMQWKTTPKCSGLMIYLKRAQRTLDFGILQVVYLVADMGKGFDFIQSQWLKAQLKLSSVLVPRAWVKEDSSQIHTHQRRGRHGEDGFEEQQKIGLWSTLLEIFHCIMGPDQYSPWFQPRNDDVFWAG